MSGRGGWRQCVVTLRDHELVVRRYFDGKIDVIFDPSKDDSYLTKVTAEEVSDLIWTLTGKDDGVKPND